MEDVNKMKEALKEENVASKEINVLTNIFKKFTKEATSEENLEGAVSNYYDSCVRFNRIIIGFSFLLLSLNYLHMLSPLIQTKLLMNGSKI